MQITRSAESPRALERAKSQASGTPNAQEIRAAIIDVWRDIDNASRVDFCDSISPKSDHGVRTRIEISGSATNVAAIPANTFRLGEMRCLFTAPKIRTWFAVLT
jgi:hypothetical protein